MTKNNFNFFQDGGCTCPGDIAKAIGAGADFVMLGGMLAGHDQSGGEIIEKDGKKRKQFYGMSSSTAMKKHKVTTKVNYFKFRITFTGNTRYFIILFSLTLYNLIQGGVAEYRASEGKTVEVDYRGDVNDTILDILGGLRSACTYVGAGKVKEMPKRTTFIRVTQQVNEVFGSNFRSQFLFNRMKIAYFLFFQFHQYLMYVYRTLDCAMISMQCRNNSMIFSNTRLSKGYIQTATSYFAFYLCESILTQKQTNSFE